MPTLTDEYVRRAQAEILLGYLRSQGVAVGAERAGDGYDLVTVSPEDLGGEVRAQLAELKHEILLLLWEESRPTGWRRRRGRRR